MSAKVDNLGIWETEQALRLLLHLMDQGQRRRLMTEQPITYAKLFPRANTSGVVRERVTNELRSLA